MYLIDMCILNFTIHLAITLNNHNTVYSVSVKGLSTLL